MDSYGWIDVCQARCEMNPMQHADVLKFEQSFLSKLPESMFLASSWLKVLEGRLRDVLWFVAGLNFDYPAIVFTFIVLAFRCIWQAAWSTQRRKSPELQVWLGQGEDARLHKHLQESKRHKSWAHSTHFNTFKPQDYILYILTPKCNWLIQLLWITYSWHISWHISWPYDRMPWQSEHVSVPRSCESMLRIADTEDVCDNKGDCCKWPVFGLQGREWFISLYCTYIYIYMYIDR